MNFRERWLSWILPYIHRAMEQVRNDPDTSYDEWRQIKQNYKEATGKDYERTS